MKKWQWIILKEAIVVYFIILCQYFTKGTEKNTRWNLTIVDGFRVEIRTRLFPNTNHSKAQRKCKLICTCMRWNNTTFTLRLQDFRGYSALSSAFLFNLVFIFPAFAALNCVCLHEKRLAHRTTESSEWLW
jgi:hypothetical protein